MEFQSVLTRKGQVTVPAEVRRRLHLKRGDRLTFRLDDGHAVVTRADSVVARTAGAFRTNEPPLTAEELREAAERAIAADVVERSGI